MEPMKISNFDLYDIVLNGDQEEIQSLKDLELEGWVKTNRDNGSIGFIALNDGTCFKNCQLVYDKQVVSNYEKLSKVNTGAAIAVKGKLVLTPEGKQPFEINVEDFEIVGEVAEDYPLLRRPFLRNL